MGIEFDILYWFQTLHNPVLDAIMVFFTKLGDAGLVWIALALVLTFTKKYRKAGITMMFALILSLIFCNGFMKNFVARPRPYWIDDSVKLLVKANTDFSFPSGHTSASFAAAIAFWLYDKKKGIAAIVVAAIISVSRMYLFMHFPSDVIASVFLGSLYGVLAFFIIKWLCTKYKKVAKFMDPLSKNEGEI